ncbi:uncharacterized protein LOC127865823 isoform X2 [Dreissena polymorpha]|uniref:uncharacterized protein LOC127865823 isoform X2 n=1 Tax=Dreissena polymorpha TaxID=45954 RepID=UPI00226400CC|nr:uncharacterized protein LOC127865823 isoform X2 [Dreissena polymorpha]
MANIFGLFLMCVCLLTVLMTINKVTAQQFGSTVNICERFLTDKNLVSLITDKKAEATPCACAEYAMAQDAIFEKVGNCYEEWLFNHGIRQRCCYSEHGKLLTGYPNGGFIILNGMEHSMDAVYMSCCHGNNQSSCTAFYEINTSNDCTRYEEPMSALSWGDPVIQTVGSPSYNYSFNGHGEYVFLKSQQGLEIQARLDYLVPGNKDATLFTAFVITQKVKNKSESIQVTFNRSMAFLSLHLTDGKLWKTSDACSSITLSQRTSTFVLKCSAGFQVIAPGGTAVDITTDGILMKIKVAHSEKLSNMTGLAGNVRSDKMYVGKNETLYPLNSSEHAMFQYGESWSIRHDENLSYFIYNVTGGKFSDYNTFSEPRFFEDSLNNFTVLFESCNKTDLSTINSTCKNTWENVFNRECLLTIARTCNISFGEAIHKEVEKQHKEFLFRSNTPPTFKNTMPNDTNMLFNGNSSWTINLTEMVNDDSMTDLRFRMEPMINGEMDIGEDGIFNWTVGTAFRNNSERTLRFVVYDAFNLSDSRTVNFQYCGCEKASECNFESDTDVTAECKCPNQFVTGTFCEITKSPCEIYDCHDQSACNKTYFGDGSPCAGCKKGYYEQIIDSKQDCIDRNECNDTNANDCDQTCINQPGYYTCSCNQWYNLDDDNKTCSDIDECQSDKLLCGKYKERCMNLPGQNFTCVCEAGYTKDSSDSECKPIVGKMYFGYLEYVLKSESSQSNDTLNGGIRNASKTFFDKINGTTGILAIEVYKIFIRSPNIHFDFIVHMNDNIELNIVVGRLKTALSGKTDMAFLGVQMQPSVEVHVYSPSEGGICNVEPKRTDCFEQSTYCVNRNITEDYYDCACRFGYKKPVSAKKREIFCDDENECEEYDDNGTTHTRCVYGHCSNTVGSWNCTCPPDRLWMSVGTPAHPVYRCQGNHSYLGNVSFIWDAQQGHINQSVIKSFLTSQISEVFSNETFDQKNMTAVTSLFVSVTILENTSYSGIPDTDLHKFTYEFRIRMGDPVSTDLLHKIGSERFKQGVKIGTVRFTQFIVFNESDNELCRRSNQGHCELRSTECKQENGTTMCVCKKGFQPSTYTKYLCEDVNECSKPDDYKCSGNGSCVNKDGNWTCNCPDYAQLVYHNNTYQDCSREVFYSCESAIYQTYKCPNGLRTCNASVWSCQCHDGYNLTGTGVNSTCIDIDECKENPCGHGICSNTDGKYSCTCNKGFELDAPRKSCIDIDECLHSNDICVNGKCTNNNGNYTCNCLNGFYEQFRNQYVTYCTDIDECTNASYSCDGKCTNLQGSFTCACPDGYENHTSGDNHIFTCKDVDECANPIGYQCIHGTCTNTNGSWDCVCGVSSRPSKLNNSVIQCIEVYRYPMQFEVQEISLPGGGHPTDKEIQGLLIKQLTYILNSSQALGGKVQLPVELLQDGYHHPLNGNITINVTVILSTLSNDSALQTVFEKSDLTQRTIMAGNILVISLSKTEIYVDQCKLHSKACDFNSTVCVFNKSEGRVSCECRTAYKNVTYHEGVGFCEPVKESIEEFAYVSSVSFTLQANIYNSSSLKETVKQQITAMYQALFGYGKIWVEIVKILGVKKRRKRSTTESASVEFILHANESINETNIKEAWENCTDVSSSCYEKVQAYSNAAFNLTYNQTVFIYREKDLCNISKVCDKNTTTCNDTSSQIECSCTAGYVNITFINETSIYICVQPADFPEATSTTVTSNTMISTTFPSTAMTSTTRPSGLSISSSSPDYTVTNRTPPTATTTSSFSEPTHNSTIHPVNSENGKTVQSQIGTSSVGTNKSQATTEVNENIVSPRKETTTKSNDGVDMQKEDKPVYSSNTALIATGASLGSVVLILMITIIVVCRLRRKKARDAETIKLKELEKDHRNGFDNSLLGRNYLRSDSKQNSTNDLRESDRDGRLNSYYGGPFKPVEPNYTRPFRLGDPDSTWDRNGHVPGMKGKSGSLPDINDHVDMRLARERRRLSYQRDPDPLYSSPKKEKYPPPTQKPMDNYKQNMVRVFPESGERLPRARNSQFPRNTGNGRISPEPDYHAPPRSPKPDYHDKRSRDRLYASNDSGLNGFSRSSGSPDVQRSRESFGYGSLGRGRYRMEGTPF